MPGPDNNPTPPASGLPPINPDPQPAVLDHQGDVTSEESPNFWSQRDSYQAACGAGLAFRNLNNGEGMDHLGWKFQCDGAVRFPISWDNRHYLPVGLYLAGSQFFGSDRLPSLTTVGGGLQAGYQWQVYPPYLSLQVGVLLGFNNYQALSGLNFNKYLISQPIEGTGFAFGFNGGISLWDDMITLKIAYERDQGVNPFVPDGAYGQEVAASFEGGSAMAQLEMLELISKLTGSSSSPQPSLSPAPPPPQSFPPSVVPVPVPPSVPQSPPVQALAPQEREELEERLPELLGKIEEEVKAKREHLGKMRNIVGTPLRHPDRDVDMATYIVLARNGSSSNQSDYTEAQETLEKLKVVIHTNRQELADIERKLESFMGQDREYLARMEAIYGLYSQSHPQVKDQVYQEEASGEWRVRP